MGRFLIYILCLILSSSLPFFLTGQAFGAFIPSGVPQKTLGGGNAFLGGITVSQLDTTYFNLNGAVTASSAQRFYPFNRNGQNYQVPDKKVTVCENVEYQADAAAGQGFQLCSATSIVIPDVTSITGAKYQGGVSNVSLYYTTAVYTFYTQPIQYNFDQNTFPCFQTASSTTRYAIHLWCREIDKN